MVKIKAQLMALWKMKQTDYQFSGIHPIVLHTHVFIKLRFISNCYNTFTLRTVNTSTQIAAARIKKNILFLHEQWKNAVFHVMLYPMTCYMPYLDKEKSLSSVLALQPLPLKDYVLIHDLAIDIDKIKWVFYLMSWP